jgi:hypothetical protein
MSKQELSKKNMIIIALTGALLITVVILIVVLQRPQTGNTHASAGTVPVVPQNRDALNVDTSHNPAPPETFMIEALKNAK